jgi:hypothetical protein
MGQQTQQTNGTAKTQQTLQPKGTKKSNRCPGRDSKGEMPPVPPHSAAALRRGRGTFIQQGTALRLLYTVTAAKGEVNRKVWTVKERSDTSTPANKTEEAPSQISVQTITSDLKRETTRGATPSPKKDNLR